MVYCVLFFYVLNIVMLFMAALGIVPSNIFYTLHIVTFLSAIGGVFVSYTMPLNKLLRYGYIFIAVAFNPFLRFYLRRAYWIWLDVIAGVLLIVLLHALLKDSEVSLTSIRTLLIAIAMIFFAWLCIVNGKNIETIFEMLLPLFGALLTSFGAYTWGLLLIAEKIPNARKEVTPCILCSGVTGMFMWAAFEFWILFFRTVGIM